MNQPLSVYILVGCSGSGKSTWAAAMTDKLKAETVNMDSIRAELCDDASDQSRNDEVYQLATRRLEAHLLVNTSAIWDNTSKNPKSRRQIIEIAKRRGAKVYGIYFETDPIAAKLRDAGRDRKVGSDVIDRQVATLVRPAFSEGFDELQTMHVDSPDYRPTLL